MQVVNTVRKHYRKLAVGAAAVVPMIASATPPSATSAFSDALASATTNVGIFAAGCVALSAVGVGFMIAAKYVKKLRGAS